MKSKKPTQASPKKRPSIASQATSNEDINDIIADITLKRARNAFCIYICDMYNKDKGANDSLTLIDTVRKYSAKWSKVSQSDKEKYEKQSEAERTKFKKDINIVKNYLFKSCREGATAYRLFLQEKLKLHVLWQPTNVVVRLDGLRCFCPRLDNVSVERSLR